MASTERRRYEALRRGDGRFDGLFFAGVLTTGVYCRAVCPVPRPAKRENVEFYPSAAAAQGAGFRPCFRCHPERSAGTPDWGPFPAVVSRALGLIAAGELDEGGVEGLAGAVGVGARQLRRLFDEHLGASPLAVAKARRVHFARRLLDETDLPATDVAFASGFRSIRQFNYDVRRVFGRSPAELRRHRGRRPVEEGWVSLRLPYRPPMDWPRAVAFLQPRATRGVEVVEHRAYRRAVEVDGAPGEIEIRVVAHEPYLVLRARLASHGGLIGIAERARRLFDLGADPLAIGGHLRKAMIVGPLARARPGLRVPGAWDPFEVAVRAILGQQISVRAATTLAERLVAGFGKPVEGLSAGLTHLFPSADVLAEADVRGIGATTAQARAIRSLAGAVASGALAIESPRGLDDFAARFCRLPGIGPWTAQYVALRACGEPDAFPASDLGLRRAAGGGSVVTERELLRVSEEWRPWRAYAAMYLWMSLSEGRSTRRSE